MRWRPRKNESAQPTAAPTPAAEPPVREIEIREEVIRLGQLLKLADLVDAGSDAKFLLAEGDVSVNGEVEMRRGRQLVPGDVVSVDAPQGVQHVRVTRPAEGDQ